MSNVGNLTNNMYQNIPKNERVALGAELIAALAGSDTCLNHESKLYKITNSKGNSGFKLRQIITETPIRYRNYAKGTRRSGGVTKLASGEEGIVYIGCLDRACKKEIAIKKVPNSEFVHSPTSKKAAIDAAEREFENLKKIHTVSDHVVTPYLFEKCGVFALQFIEYFSGGELKKWLSENRGRLREEHYRNITFQVIFALKKIQEKYPSFRHNDLHTGNILVNDKASARGYTMYGNKKLKNIGVKIAIADLGYSTINDNHTYTQKLKKEFGMSGDNNKMYDLHLFLNAMYSEARDAKLREFIKEVIGVDYLGPGSASSNKIREWRLAYPQTKNKQFLSFDEILNHSYFDVYSTRTYNRNTIMRLRPANRRLPAGLKPTNHPVLFPNLQPPAPRPRTPPVKQKTVSACGKSAKPSGVGVEKMTVGEMAAFILKNGPEDVKNILRQMPKVTRSDLCLMMQRFPAGLLLMPHYKSPQKGPATPNNVRAGRLIKQAKNHLQSTGKLNRSVIAKVKTFLSKAEFAKFSEEQRKMLMRIKASGKVANFIALPKKSPVNKKKTSFVLPSEIRLTKNNIRNKVEPLKWKIYSTLFDKLKANSAKASTNLNAAEKAHRSSKTANTKAVLNAARIIKMRTNANLAQGQSDVQLQLMAGTLAREQIKEQIKEQKRIEENLKEALRITGLNSNSNSNSNPATPLPNNMIRAILNKIINNATMRKPEISKKIKEAQNKRLKPTGFITSPKKLNLPENPVAPPVQVFTPVPNKKKTAAKKLAAVKRAAKPKGKGKANIPTGANAAVITTYSRNNNGRVRINPKGARSRLCSTLSKPDIEAYLQLKGIVIPSKINGKNPTKAKLCELLMA